MVKSKEQQVIRLLSSIVIPNNLRGEDIQTFVGVIKAEDLMTRYAIPYWEHESQRGYQRNLEERRVKKFAESLKDEEVSIPTSLLLSVRDDSVKPKYVNEGIYELPLPPAGQPVFYVVDGQHRLMALQRLIEENPSGPWSQWRISAVFMFTSDEYVEMSQFHIVNTNARSVKTDLAIELLAKRMGHVPGMMHTLPKRDSWKIQALRLTEEVSKRGDWLGLIQFANQEKGNTIIRQNSFVSSLRLASRETVFTAFNPKQREEIIRAYWEGIRQILPDCFHEPRKYALQKTVGVFVMHRLLPDVLIRVKFNQNDHNDANAYAYMLENALLNLVDENKLSEPVSGADFWLSGRFGAAGRYSSGSGQDLLAERLRSELTPI
ncbi:MAG: DGQHR domain-containing protein [Chloroflexi bacterium]|nr:DGQHR domain-containing protein [Anaerolineaceae bacterium]MCY4106473.1 DGQHR domain-containing protein [Chloroflexota bacterium]